jgi:predicted transglutaminase-like cysteine proteinase
VRRNGNIYLFPFRDEGTVAAKDLFIAPLMTCACCVSAFMKFRIGEIPLGMKRTRLHRALAINMADAAPAAMICVILLVTAALSTVRAAGTGYFGDEIAALGAQSVRIAFKEPTLAPIGYTEFCLRYRDDCEARGSDLPWLSMLRWDELSFVNQQVNRTIVPKTAPADPIAEQWQLSPLFGNCNDYAVTKRHDLLVLGWPTDALLLSEVVTRAGEHHLILVAHTKTADMVLDNLDPAIRSVGSTAYRWVRAESPANPKFWSRVSVSVSGISHGVAPAKNAAG